MSTDAFLIMRYLSVPNKYFLHLTNHLIGKMLLGQVGFFRFVTICFAPLFASNRNLALFLTEVF